MMVVIMWFFISACTKSSWEGALHETTELFPSSPIALWMTH